MLGRVACVVLVMLLLPAVSLGSDAKEGWSLRVNGTFTDPDKRTVVMGADQNEVEAVASEALGLALSLEYRFSNRVGLELGVQAGYESDVAVTVTPPPPGSQNDGLTLPEDGLRFTMVDIALNFYLTKGPIDFYVGPVFGFIAYDDLALTEGAPWVPVDVQVDGDVAVGAVLGLDLPCGERGWFFTSSLKYLDSTYEADFVELGTGAQEIDFDPLIVRAGFGYRF